MKTNEILENSKLIAEFMGAYREEGQSNNILSVWLGGDEWYIDTNDEESSRFHSSWDWLMPVVEKIERLDDADTVVNIQDDTCNIGGGDFVFTANCYSKIDSVYNAVVGFIKWYNNRATK